MTITILSIKKLINSKISCIFAKNIAMLGKKIIYNASLSGEVAQQVRQEALCVLKLIKFVINI